MRRPGTLMVSILTLALVGVALLVAQPGGATPEEVYQRFVDAANDRNWEEMASCVSPDALVEINSSMVMVGGMVVAFAAMGEGMAEETAEEGQAEAAEIDAEALQAEFDALLARHGVDEAAMEALQGDEDAPAPEAFHSAAFFSDLMGFIDSLPGEGGETMVPPEGALENLVIDGDTATASVSGNPGGFVRIDGRWYVDVSERGGEDVDQDMEQDMEQEEEAAE